MRPRPVAAALAALAVLLPGTPAAAPPGRPAVLRTCAGCHGADGVSVAAHIPNLAAQSPAYLAAQIEAFRSGDRMSKVMGPIAKGLAADQVAGITAYFGSLPGATPGARSGKTADFASRAALPASFPVGFTRYHVIDTPARGRVIVFYANPAAREAARAGRELTDGAVIVASNYEAERDAKGEPRLGASGGLVPGKLLAHAVMARGPGWGAAIPELVRNGDWHYSLVDAEGKPRPADNHAECLACHKPLAASSYVFTLDKLAGR